MIQGSLALAQAAGKTEPFREFWNKLNPSNNGYAAFNLMWQQQFFCLLSNDTALPECNPSVAERKQAAIDAGGNTNFYKPNCRCTGDEKAASLPRVVVSSNPGSSDILSRYHLRHNQHNLPNRS
jgi:hypothetical protein